MANPGSIIGQISEEFGELGKQVVKEAVKAPKDIAGIALESLGTSSGKQQGNFTQSNTKPTEGGVVDQFTNEKNQLAKKAIARAALEELAGRPAIPKELSVRERIEAEERQKKELLAKQQAQAQQNVLQPATPKRKRGDLFGVQAKRSSAERKNVRQD